MANKLVDYTKLLSNVEQMINLLEYDAMRGSGKTKLNASTIADLYQLKDRYEAKLGKIKEVPATVVAAEAPVKKGPGRPPKV